MEAAILAAETRVQELETTLNDPEFHATRSREAHGLDRGPGSREGRSDALIRALAGIGRALTAQFIESHFLCVVGNQLGSEYNLFLRGTCAIEALRAVRRPEISELNYLEY